MYNLELKIKDLARQKDLSMRKVCQKIDMSENGLALGLRNNTIKLDTLSKISEVLHIPITYFFTDVGDLPVVAVGSEVVRVPAVPVAVESKEASLRKALQRERKKNEELTTAVLNLSKH